MIRAVKGHKSLLESHSMKELPRSTDCSMGLSPYAWLQQQMGKPGPRVLQMGGLSLLPGAFPDDAYVTSIIALLSLVCT